MDGGAIFIYVVLAAFPALIVVAAVYKYMEVSRASRWPKAQGRVVVSTSEARSVKAMDPKSEDTELRTFAKIEYEFTVAGRKYRGNRVSIGEDLGNFQVAETIAKYPRGKDVTVYYNPRKPTECVLEREMPPGMWKGIIIIVLVLAGLIVAGIVGFHKLGDVMSGLVRNPSQAPVVAGCVGFAILAALVVRAILRGVAEQRAWPRAQGRIVSSGVREFQQLEDRDSGPDRWRTAYRPEIVYNYEVAGVRYTSDQGSGTTRFSTNVESIARKKADKYPAGTVVQVYYNPKNPAESLLNLPGRWLLLLWLIPAFALAIAYIASR